MRPKALSGSIAKYSRGLALSVLTLIGASQAPGATFYWDTDGTGTAGAGATPTGTWGFNAFWSPDSTGANIGSPVLTALTLNTDNLYFVAGPSATSGNNAYTVTVLGPQVANSLNFQASGATTISGGTLITLGNGQFGGGGINIPQFAYGSTNNGAVTISTAITLNNSQTWTNNSASLLTIQTGALTFNGNALTISGSGDTTITSVLTNGSGNSSLIKSGAGTLTLNQANTFTGAFIINNGTVKANGNIGALGTGTAILALGGGTLDFNHTAGLNFARNTTVFGDTTIISELNAAGAGVTYTLGALTIGANTLSVGGGNVTSGTAGLTFSSTTLNGNATFNITKPTGGGTTLLTVVAITGNNNSLKLQGNGDFAQTAAWSGTGSSLILDTTYAGTATLNQTNTFTGGVNINSTAAGILVLTTNASAVNSGPITFGSGSTGILRVQVTSAIAGLNTNATVGSPIVENGSNSAITLTVNNPVANTFAGVIRDNNGGGPTGTLALTKGGGGTLTLSGNNAYTGITTLSAGILRAQGNANALGLNSTAGALTLSGAGAELQLADDTGLNFGRNATVGASMQITTDRITTGAGVTNTLGALVLTTTPVLTIAGGSNVNSGTAGLTLGALTLSSGATFMVNNPVNGGATQLNLSGGITGNNNLTFAGSGTTSLTAASTSTFNTTINKGTLSISGATGSINLNNVVSILNNGTLTLDNTTNNTNRLNNASALQVNGGTLNFTNPGTAATNYTETTGATTVNPGQFTINTSQAASDGTTILTLGTVTRTAGGTVLFSGTGFGVDARNQVKVSTTALSAQNVQGILPFALIKDGTTYDLAVGGAIGAAVTKFVSYDTASGDASWGAAVNARPNAAILLTGAKSLNALVLDDTINFTGPAADSTITMSTAASRATIVQTGGSSLIAKDGTSGYIFSQFAGSEFIFQTIGTLTIEQGTNAPITWSAANAANHITKTGLGTLNLGSSTNLGFSIANMSTGGTFTINQGTVRVNSNGSTAALGTGSAALTINGGRLEIADNAALNLGRNTTINGDATIVSDTTSSSAGVTHTLGTLTLTNTPTLSILAGSNVNSGTAGITFGAVTLNATIGTAGAVLDVGANSTLTLGAITGNATNFTKQGAGTLILSGASGRTGTLTTLADGTLRLTADAGAGTTGVTLALNGGTFDIATNTVNAYPIIVGGNTTINVGRATAGTAAQTLGTLQVLGDRTITVAAGSNLTADSAYSLTFGAVTLNGNPTFSISGNGAGTGTLKLNSGFNTGGVTQTITLNSGTGTSAAEIGGAFTGTAGTLELAGNTPTIAVGTAVVLTAQANNLKISGSGTYTFGGTNVYTGYTYVNNTSANVVATNVSGFGANGRVVFQQAPASFELRFDGSNTFTAGLDTTAAGVPIIVNRASSAGTATTHTLNQPNFLGGNTISVSAGSNITSGTAYGLTLSAATVLSGSPTFTINGNGAGIGTLTLSGGFDVQGTTRTITLNNNTGTSNAVISGAFAGAPGTLELAGTTTAVTVNALTGANPWNLKLSGSGTYTLAGANTYTGNTILNNTNGTVIATVSAAFGTTAGRTIVNQSGITIALRAAGTSYTTGLDTSANSVTVQVEPASAAAGVVHTINGTNTFANQLTMSPGSFSTSSTYGLTFSGTSALVGNTTFVINNNNGGGAGTLSIFTLSGDNKSLTLKGAGNFAQIFQNNVFNPWSGVGSSLVLDATYSGVATLSQANTFTGGTTLSGGTLQIIASSLPVVGPFFTGGTGPLGTGTLTINGTSTVTADTPNNTGRAIANDLAINTSGTVTFSALGALNINGQNQSISGGPTLTFNSSTGNPIFGAYAMSLNSNVTLNGTGVGPVFNAGLTVGGGAGTRTITDSLSTSVGVLTIAGPLTLNSNLTFGGTHTGAITMTGITTTVVGSGGITLAFSDAAGTNGLTTYTTGPLVLGGDFTLTGNTNKKPTVTINGLRVANGITSNFSLENDTTKITLTLGSGANNDWIIGGTLNQTWTAPAQTIASTLVGAGTLTFTNGSTGVTLSANSPLYTGTITVGNGINATKLLNGATTGLPIFANYSLAAGTTTLDINANSAQIGSLAGGTSGTVTNTGSQVRTLTVGNASNTNYSGLITASTPANLALTKIGTGKLTLNNATSNTYTGATSVLAGELALDLTNFTSGYQNEISSSSALTVGGGTISVKSNGSAGAVAVQTFNGTTFNAGASAITYDSNSADASSSLALGAIARNAGSTARFNLLSSGNITTTSTTFLRSNVLASSASSSGIAFATVGGDNWASLSSGNIIALAGGNQQDDDFGASTNNVNVTAVGAPSAFTINSLRFNTNSVSLALDNSGPSTIGTGGILVASGITTTLSGGSTGTLKPGAGKELVVINNGTLLNLSAVLGDNATSAVTYSGPGTTDLTGNTNGNTYVGATYLNQGTLKINANNQLGAVATGAALNINGGTLQITGSIALDNSGSNKRAVAVGTAGATLDIGSNSVTISGVISSTLANAGLLTKTGTGGTLTLSGANTFTGGFSFGGGNLNIGNAAALGGAAPNFFTIAGATTLDNTTGAAVASTNSPAMNWNANFSLVGAATATDTTRDINLGTGPVLMGGNRTITVGTGSNLGTLTVGGVIHDGGNNYSLTKAGNGTLLLSGNSTYSGGTTLSAGTLAISASSTGTLGTHGIAHPGIWPANGGTLSDLSPGVVFGPLGTGTLTLSGGTLRSTSATSYTIHNALIINGNVTLGDFVNTGGITFAGASQQVTGTSTILARSAVNLGIGYTWGANAVTYRGPGLVTIASQNTNNTGNITIGDGTTFSGNDVGGNVSVNFVNALGSSPVTINYGGTLRSTNAFAPTNAFTVNNGGTLNLRGPITPRGLITLNSGATLATSMSVSGANNPLFLAQGTNVSFPTAGVLFLALDSFNLGTPTGGTNTVSNAYPNFTGTMAFGGSGFWGLITLAPTTVSSATTLAFNYYSTNANSATLAPATLAAMNLNGLVLDADLKVAGSGLNWAMGFIPLGSSGTLGNITNSGTARNIVVEMSPLGIARVTGSNGWANTTINSGTFESSGADTGIGALGSGTLTLNGGALRITGATSKAITVGPKGGAIDTVTGGQNYSGTVGGTSTAGLVLRSGSSANGNTVQAMSVTGDFTGFNGNITLATTATAQPISLAASVLPTNTSYSVIVPSGIAFSGAAFTSATSSRFTTTTDSIFIPGAASVDLSSGLGGLNKDISIGLNGSNLTGYTPFGSTYRLVPLTVATTLSSSIFSGATNLEFSAAAVITDRNSNITGTYGQASNGLFSSAVTITASQGYTGTTKVTGTIMPAGYTNNGSNIVAPANLVVQNTLGTTRIDVQRFGSFTVNGASGAVASATVINVSGGSTFTSGDTTNNNVARLIDSAVITLGGNSGIASGGGTFTFANQTAVTETVGSLVVAAGANSMSATTGTLSFGGGATTAYARNAGGVLLASGNVQFANAQTNTASTAIGTAGGAQRILIGTFLNAGADFALAAGAPAVLAAPTYSTNNAVNTWADDNIRVNGAISGGTVTTGSTINSLKIMTTAPTIALAGTLDIRSGMIINQIPSTVIQNGTALTTGGSDYLVNTSATLTISSPLTTAVPFTKAGAGALTLNNAGNLITDIYVAGGTLTSSQSGSLGATGTSRRLYLLNGGTINFANSTTQNYTSTGLTVDASGTAGTWTDGGTAAISSFGGTVALNGWLRVTGLGEKALTGDISGTGTLRLPTASRMTLSGDNSQLTGGITLSGGAQVRLNNLNAAGAGSTPIFNGDAGGSAGIGIVEFTNAFGTINPVLTNDLLVASAFDGTGKSHIGTGFLISNAKTGVNSAVTLSGRIASNGLTFQGVDTTGTGGSVSETVLSGTVATSGRPQNYNYAGPGSGATTNFQQFINGQSGINLGVTAYSGNTAARLAYGTSGFLAYNAGTTTPVENGAEGYVRFAPDANGNLNSFLPGAVGPGYVAALRKGGASTANFGYLLTGASSGSALAGTTASGSNVITGIASTAGYAVGQAITGTNIPGSTTILRIIDGTSLVLSNNATTAGAITDLAISGSGNAYQLPEGKSFVIGTLGSGTGQTGTFGATGTGTNTATFLGNPKAAAGQLLAGFNGGDINIHANAATDTATLNLSARAAGDTLVLGDGVTAANNVVITPTWGDSGASSAVTLLQKRTGLTTLKKTGAGTVEIKGVNLTHTDGTNASGVFTWDVNVGTLKLNGTGVNTTILTDGNTATTSDILISGGTLELAASEQIANTGSINMTSGAFNFGAATGLTETIDKFTNSGGTFSTGANILIGLGNTVTWSGGTNTVSNGGAVQDAHIVISGGTNTVEGGATGGVLQLNASGTGLEMSNGSTLTLNSDNGVAGKLLLKGDVSSSGDSTVTIASGLALTNKGNIDLDNGTRTFTVADGTADTDMSISAVITNTGSIIKDGAGTLSLDAANTYSGTTTITNGGTLIANVLGALPLSPRSAVSFTGTGTSALNLGANQFVASLSSAGAATVALGSYTLTVGAGSGNTTFAGSIGGTGGNLVKDDASTQVLSGNNGYTGTTTVSGGTLEVQGSLSGTTGVTVNTGGTLLMNNAATPAINSTAPVTLAGGTLAFGNAANQTQNLGAMTLTANSILDFGAGGGNDKFHFAGFVNTAGTLAITNWLGNDAGGTDGAHDRLVFTGSFTDFTTSFSQSQISFNGTSGYAAIDFGSTYEIVPVPEPATTALIGSIALCALIGYRERRRFTGLGKRIAARK